MQEFSSTMLSALSPYLKSIQHTHTHPFNGPLSGTTQLSWYQKGKTNLDFTGARDSEWQWHQLGHMQVCTSLQTDNHASSPPLCFFTGRMPFLPPNQQRQSTEGTKSPLVKSVWKSVNIWWSYGQEFGVVFLTHSVDQTSRQTPDMNVRCKF